MKDMFRVCESLYAELRSLKIEDNYYEAFSIHLSGADHALYIAETCEIGGAYETSRKGGAAICEDAEGNVESAMLLKAAKLKKRIERKDAQMNVARERRHLV